METLNQKPDTKRPVIVRAATSLFAERGIDGTSMRAIAEAAGVREAAIYRHFAGKDDLAREIFLSWYGWYCEKLQRIVSGPGGILDKLHEIVRHEFTAVTDHSDAFVYFCENEARFVRSLPPEIASARRVFTAFIRGGQAQGEVRAGSPDLLADMLSGALCAVALTWLGTGRRKKLNTQLEEVVQGCWGMIKA
ncbi:MAG: TetR/AcrR family transcriptional regulator [Candidatus Binatus sp.]|uniref:TetR/AcrR family transcriptional regulator n=1 Tax=Candidatus Binatus sp. TaxID=2811406 RepID=UPI002721C48F|nr:TetR/AcrR family transcriptional regulator [Candidatus Binatus sp.]MDO8431218.1 TetR/AcrR family transcriptional regulator [Candidatus Binatus sp.]